MAGRIKYPNGRPCACGCGQLAKRHVHHDTNKGWYKYAEGHQPPSPFGNPATQAKAKAKQYARIPIGSRRITAKGRGRIYWEIKVAGRKRWMLEHRHIMEQRLGRPLLSSEHVHHRDNNGLNNGLNADGEDNLVLLSAVEHMRMTARDHPPLTCKCTCPTCGQTHFRKGG